MDCSSDEMKMNQKMLFVTHKMNRKIMFENIERNQKILFLGHKFPNLVKLVQSVSLHRYRPADEENISRLYPLFGVLLQALA